MSDQPAVGDVRVRIVKPVDAEAVLPVVVHMHGDGWILGNAGTHDRLVRSERSEITASPNRATADQLRGAGVPVTTVRHDGTVHDVMLLNLLTGTRATRASVDQAAGFLRAALAPK
jgi:acetyl esterase/lipase